MCEVGRELVAFGRNESEATSDASARLKRLKPTHCESLDFTVHSLLTNQKKNHQQQTSV